MKFYKVYSEEAFCATEEFFVSKRNAIERIEEIYEDRYKSSYPDEDFDPEEGWDTLHIDEIETED